MQNFYLLNLAAHLSLLACYFVCGALILLLYRMAIKDYFDTMSDFGWLLWPDVDVKFRGGKEFIEKYTNKKFTRYIIFFWPARVMRIFGIFAGHILGYALIFFVAIYLWVYDSVTEKKETKANDSHNQDVIKKMKNYG